MRAMISRNTDKAFACCVNSFILSCIFAYAVVSILILNGSKTVRCALRGDGDDDGDDTYSRCDMNMYNCII